MTEKNDEKLTVLLVDDEASVIKSLKRLLSSLDVVILEAQNGKEALEVLQNNPVALIISDQKMPVMTGVEFLKEANKIAPDTLRILLTGYADIEATIAAINDGDIRYYLNKPWDNDLLLSRVKESLDLFVIQKENKRLQLLTTKQNQQLQALNGKLAQKVKEQTKEIKTQHEELGRSFMDTIKTLSIIMEMRYQDVGSHCQRVAMLTQKLLGKLDLGQKDYQDIIIGAYLHDIGKIALKESIVNHTLELAGSAREELKRHTVLGQSCVLNISGFDEVGLIIRHHHENYDGSGYPDNLRESRIPMGARIIRIVDAFDHEAFEKGYPDMKKLNEASANLVRKSGSDFDPDLVRKFIDLDLPRQMYQGDGIDVITVKPEDLEEGMIVLEEIYTQNGLFLLPKGATLSPGMIGRINKIHRYDPVKSAIRVSRKPVSSDDHVDNFMKLDNNWQFPGETHADKKTPV